MRVRLERTSVNPSESDAGHVKVKRYKRALCNIDIGKRRIDVMDTRLRLRDHGIYIDSPLIPTILIWQFLSRQPQ